MGGHFLRVLQLITIIDHNWHIYSSEGRLTIGGGVIYQLKSRT